MKPNQFQKEKVCLFNIPAQDSPYRIVGTKIAIISDKPINEGRYDPDATKELFVAVQLAIDVLKRGSKDNERAEEFKYDCLEITEAEVDYLSHKQQLQILNELTTLRKEVRNLINHKDRWVEVITNDVVQQSKASYASRHGGNAGLSKDDLTLTDQNMSTAQVDEQISQLKEKPDPELLGRRPPPDDEEWRSYADRPLSPESEERLRAQQREEEERRRQQLAIDYQPPQAGPKRYHSKYRPIAEFKRNYESEYQQSKLRPSAPRRQPRDFVQENIDNQQYYRRGGRSRIGQAAAEANARDIHMDRSGRQYTNDQLTELMMRIHLQKLAYQAKAGKPDAYKQLVVAQQQFLDRMQEAGQREDYDAVAQQALEELYKSQATQEEQEQLIQQLRKSIQEEKRSRLQSQVQQSVHLNQSQSAPPLQDRVSAAQTASLVSQINNSKMYKVVLPQFSPEYLV